MSPARKPARPTRWDLLAERLDGEGMGARIESFPAMLRAGASIAAPALRGLEPVRPRRLVLLGMGGSAMAGDLLRAWADREGTVPVHVVRHYEPPVWITPEDFLVFSSYSGETEETLAAYAACRPLGAPSCAFAAGGSLLARARADGVPVAVLPGGHPPRAALGYSFSALAALADHLQILARAPERVERAAEGLAGLASACARNVVESRNPAKKLAIRLAGRGLLLIANPRTLEPAALRWKGQLNENAKQLAWVSALPEMNHNEVDSFLHPKGLGARLTAVLLRDPGDHPRVARRFEWLRTYLGRQGVPVETVTAEGPEPLARLLHAVLLGDFVSYYLALRNGADPSALPGVTLLKRALAT